MPNKKTNITKNKTKLQPTSKLVKSAYLMYHSAYSSNIWHIVIRNRDWSSLLILVLNNN